MASILLIAGGVFGLLGLKKAIDKNEDNDNVYAQERYYVPQGSTEQDPRNLPTVLPYYALPETNPEMMNQRSYHLGKPKKTGSFLDAFEETLLIDNVADIKNAWHPNGPQPNIKMKNQSTLYIEAQSPMEFKPPKREVYHSELYRPSNIVDNNVFGNLDYSTGYGKRYAKLSVKENGGLGAKDYYTMWDNETKQDPTVGWFGKGQITRRYHDHLGNLEDRVYPPKESYMSTRQEIGMRIMAPPYAGVALDLAPALGRYEFPDNEDVIYYTRAPLPTGGETGDLPTLRPSCINVKTKNMVNTPVYSHGCLDLGTNADIGINEDGRVNNNSARGSLKDFMTLSAANATHLIPNKTRQSMQIWPDFPGCEVRRVLPDIRRIIDPDILQPYMSNPYTPKITNMPYV